MSDATAPNFLGIGVQRSATTWLGSALRRHPEVWLSPRKELHYFSRSASYPTPAYLGQRSTRRDGLKRLWNDEPTRRRFSADFGRMIRRTRDTTPLWLYRYYCGIPNDEWYSSLFVRAGSRTSGEITPAYSMLDHADVQKVERALPEVKALLILRDPVDRAWSQLRFFSTKGWFKGIDSPESVLEFMDSKKQTSRGQYVKCVHNWTEVLGPERLWIGFYDHVVSEPDSVLDDVADFLEISPRGFRRSKARQERRNESPSRPMPVEVEQHLAAMYLPQLLELEPLVGGPVSDWITRSEAALDKVP